MPDNAEDLSPIVVKKIVRGGGHHGGAWKVAYADFVTAMMAFFLLLWLLNVTTDEQKLGIAEYFAPTVASRSQSGSGGLLGGVSISPDGARVSSQSPPTFVVELAPPKQRQPTDNDVDADKEKTEFSEEELLEKVAEREQALFEQAESELRQAIQEVPDLKELGQNLMIDNTPEGLRIQIVDQEGRSMFPSGASQLFGHTKLLLTKIAEIIERLPNRIAITGHTDATPFRNSTGYGNWELSSDRANSSRRALLEAGLTPDRIARVTGKADTEPLIAEDPGLPTNRRISIVLLREAPAAAKRAASGPAPRPTVGPAPGLPPKAER